MERFQEAMKLYATFLDKGSVRFIGVSEEALKRLQSQLLLQNYAEVDLFDEVQDEIFKWLEETAYKQFLVSEECQDLLVQLEEQEAVVHRLIENHAI